MEGSQHVQQLGLHDRYNLDVRIVLSWTEASSGPTLMETDGNIMVEASARKYCPIQFMCDLKCSPCVLYAGRCAQAILLHSAKGTEDCWKCGYDRNLGHHCGGLKFLV